MPERKAGREVGLSSFVLSHAYARKGRRGMGLGIPRTSQKTDFCAAFLGSIVTMIDASKDALRVSLAHRRGGFPGASGGPRFRTIQDRPKDLRALLGQPKRAVSWHSGFQRGSPWST
jgi:hypothetical protein